MIPILLVGLALVLPSDPHATSTARCDREVRNIAGWEVHVSCRLLAEEPEATRLALDLLQSQLEQITHVVPKAALGKLQKVSLWISPEYPGTRPKAEFHPNVNWLREHGRDSAMAEAVEFTNVRIFEAEVRRMPNFALHELAHAYHFRELQGGFGNAEIRAAFQHARKSGTYDRVERRHGDGRKNTFQRAYAMTNPMEYFAETSEAFFSRNDFFPFDKEELRKHDPEMFQLLGKLWGVLP